MKKAKVWAYLMTGVLTFSTFANDFIVASAEEAVTDQIEADYEAEADPIVTADDGLELTFVDEEPQATEPENFEEGGADNAVEEPAAEPSADEQGDPDEAAADGQLVDEFGNPIVTDDAEAGSEDKEEADAEEEEEEEADEKKDEEVSYPAINDSGAGITVSAPEGAFPDGTTVSISEVTVSASELGLSADECEQIRAWDVTFYYNGEEIQPRDGYSVEVNLDIAGMGDDVEAYHIHEGGVSEIAIDGDGVVSTSEFSTFVVIATDKDGNKLEDDNIEIVESDEEDDEEDDPLKSTVIDISVGVKETKSYNFSKVDRLHGITAITEENGNKLSSAAPFAYSVSNDGKMVVVTGKSIAEGNYVIKYNYASKDGEQKSAQKEISVSVSAAASDTAVKKEGEEAVNGLKVGDVVPATYDNINFQIYGNVGSSKYKEYNTSPSKIKVRGGSVKVRPGFGTQYTYFASDEEIRSYIVSFPADFQKVVNAIKDNGDRLEWYSYEVAVGEDPHGQIVLHANLIENTTPDKSTSYTIKKVLVDASTGNELEVLEERTVSGVVGQKMSRNWADEYYLGYTFIESSTLNGKVTKDITLKADANENVLILKFKKDKVKSKVQFFYSGVADTKLLDGAEALPGSEITYSAAPTKTYNGREYKLDHIEPVAQASVNENDNIVKVYYKLIKVKTKVRIYYGSDDTNGVLVDGPEFKNNATNVKLPDTYAPKTVTYNGREYSRVGNVEPLAQVTEDEDNNVFIAYYKVSKVKTKVRIYYGSDDETGILVDGPEATNGAANVKLPDTYAPKTVTYNGREYSRVGNVEPLAQASENEDNNIFEAYYKLSKVKTTIRYYYDGKEGDTEDGPEVKPGEATSYKISTDAKTRTYEGKVYNYDTVAQCAEPSENEDENIIKVYYKLAEVKYQIVYHYQNQKRDDYDKVTSPILDGEQGKDITISDEEIAAHSTNAYTYSYSIKYDEDNILNGGSGFDVSYQAVDKPGETKTVIPASEVEATGKVGNNVLHVYYDRIQNVVYYSILLPDQAVPDDASVQDKYHFSTGDYKGTQGVWQGTANSDMFSTYNKGLNNEWKDYANDNSIMDTYQASIPEDIKAQMDVWIRSKPGWENKSVKDVIWYTYKSDEDGYTMKNNANKVAYFFINGYIPADNQIYNTTIQVNAKGAEKTYDGTALTNDELDYDTRRLPEGYTLKAEMEETSTVTHVYEGNVPNIIKAGSITVWNGDTEVTSQFPHINDSPETNLNTNPGVLKINPKGVTVTSGSDRRKYDGSPLTCDEVTVEGIVDGETIGKHAYGSVTDVAENVPNSPIEIVWGGSMAAVSDLRGGLENLSAGAASDDSGSYSEKFSSDYSANRADYKVTSVIPGTLTVYDEPATPEIPVETPKTLDVTVTGGKYVYDGKPHGPSILVTGDGVESYSSGPSEGPVEVLGADGTLYKVAVASSNTSVIDVGTKWAICDSLAITDGTKDVTDLFTINYHYENNAVIVTPAPLKVVTESKKEVDKGQTLTAPGTISGLVPRDETEVVFTVTGSQKGVGSSDNSYVISWNGASALNYILSEDIGKLELTQETPVTPEEPGTTPEEPGTTPEEPGTTPGEPTTTTDITAPILNTPAATPVSVPLPTVATTTIPDEDVPLAGVLGMQRGIEADAASVLGSRISPNQGVLGARRDAQTSDSNQMALYLILMGIATGVGGAYTSARRRKRDILNDLPDQVM